MVPGAQGLSRCQPREGSAQGQLYTLSASSKSRSEDWAGGKVARRCELAAFTVTPVSGGLPHPLRALNALGEEMETSKVSELRNGQESARVGILGEETEAKRRM